MQIITTKQYKLDKGIHTHGVLTAGIQLSPAYEAREVLNRPDLRTVCPFSGACEIGCLKHTGRNQMPSHAVARAKRTALYWDNPTAFYDQVIHELHAVGRKAERMGLAFAIRPNMLQDLPPLADRIARSFPDAAVYDYTKIPAPWRRTRKLANYTIAYSVSERSTNRQIHDCVRHGINCAVIFDTPKGEPLPSTYTLAGHTLPVIDGDVSDLLYTYPVGVWIGLRWKGSRARLAEGLAAGWVRPGAPTIAH
jgi:hypothetical protein